MCRTILAPNIVLAHGDYHPGNVCVTKDSKMIVLDWDSIEIGDPAYDVGYAYHFVKFFSNPTNPNLAQRTGRAICLRIQEEFRRRH